MENTIEPVFKTEDQFQAAFIKWFDNKYPEFRRDLFAVPNGGDRVGFDGNKFKATGVRAGVTDLIWVLPYEVQFIELKLPGKFMQMDQIKFMNRVTKLGHEHNVFFSLWKLQQFVINKIKDSYGKV